MLLFVICFGKLYLHNSYASHMSGFSIWIMPIIWNELGSSLSFIFVQKQFIPCNFWFQELTCKIMGARVLFFFFFARVLSKYSVCFLLTPYRVLFKLGEILFCFNVWTVFQLSSPVSLRLIQFWYSSHRYYSTCKALKLFVSDYETGRWRSWM